MNRTFVGVRGGSQTLNECVQSHCRELITVSESSCADVAQQTVGARANANLPNNTEQERMVSGTARSAGLTQYKRTSRSRFTSVRLGVTVALEEVFIVHGLLKTPRCVTYVCPHRFDHKLN